MESLMRFGRNGCIAVLTHYNDWVTQNDADPHVSRNQIAYSKVAKDLWFASPKNRVLQDVWNNRVKNKDPTRGCLRKVISMVVMVGTDIRLKRKKKWFCEARRHAGKHSHMLSRHSQLYDDREIGDRNELVLFSRPGDQSELDAVFESVYSEASKLFTNNRTKDQAVILAAFLQKLCYYPVRGIHSANWLARKKKQLKQEAELMDREVRQHLLRPQPVSRKRKADFIFPETSTKMSRIGRMPNYVNPMSGLVHRHAPYKAEKLPVQLGTTHHTLATTMKNLVMLNNRLVHLQRNPYTNGGSNHRLTRFPALTHLGLGVSLAEIHKHEMQLREELQRLERHKQARIRSQREPQPLHEKRQQLLHKHTDNSLVEKRSQSQTLDSMLTAPRISYPLSPQSYMDLSMGPYLIYRDVQPLRLPPSSLHPYSPYVHPISLALNNPLYKAAFNTASYSACGNQIG